MKFGQSPVPALRPPGPGSKRLRASLAEDRQIGVRLGKKALRWPDRLRFPARYPSATSPSFQGSLCPWWDKRRSQGGAELADGCFSARPRRRGRHNLGDRWAGCAPSRSNGLRRSQNNASSPAGPSCHSGWSPCSRRPQEEIDPGLPVAVLGATPLSSVGSSAVRLLLEEQTEIEKLAACRTSASIQHQPRSAAGPVDHCRRGRGGCFGNCTWARGAHTSPGRCMGPRPGVPG